MEPRDMMNHRKLAIWLKCNATPEAIRALPPEAVLTITSEQMLGKPCIREYWVQHAMAQQVNAMCDHSTVVRDVTDHKTYQLMHTTREAIRTVAEPDVEAQQDALKKIHAKARIQDEATIQEKLGLDAIKTGALFERLDNFYSKDEGVQADAADRVLRQTRGFMRGQAPASATIGY